MTEPFFFERDDYGLEYAIQIFENLIVPETENAKPIGRDPLLARLVSWSFVRVLPTVYLDHEFMREAREVDRVRAHRMLASELETFEPAIPERQPELPLRIRLPLA